jgi:hypothetical protein
MLPYYTSGNDAKQYEDFINSSVGKFCIARYGEAMDSGRNRIVFESKFCVVKAPLNLEGVDDNQKEARLFNTNKKNMYAKCRLAKVHNTYLLVMERLRELKWNERDILPEWAKSLTDGQQVGFNSKGKILAYDYAMELD